MVLWKDTDCNRRGRNLLVSLPRINLTSHTLLRQVNDSQTFYFQFSRSDDLRYPLFGWLRKSVVNSVTTDNPSFQLQVTHECYMVRTTIHEMILPV